MKVIIVPVADRPECRLALDQAFVLAEKLSSNVIGCHLRPHRAETASRPINRFQWRLARPSKPPATGTDDDIELKRKAAEELFLEHAKEHDFVVLKRPRLGIERGALWFEMVGALDKLFSIVGPVADVSIVSRPMKVARGRGPEFLLSAILHSGKPVLVLPQEPVSSLGRRVLIPWNQSVEAARAVAASMPLLARAESIHICTCGPETRAGPKAKNLQQYLTFWGVKSTTTSTKGAHVPEEIEEVSNQTGSDLLVMGAYSRSRMTEVIFGGVTQHMLFETTKPVFAFHS